MLQPDSARFEAAFDRLGPDWEIAPRPENPLALRRCNGTVATSATTIVAVNDETATGVGQSVLTFDGVESAISYVNDWRSWTLDDCPDQEEPNVVEVPVSIDGADEAARWEQVPSALFLEAMDDEAREGALSFAGEVVVARYGNVVVLGRFNTDHRSEVDLDLLASIGAGEHSG